MISDRPRHHSLVVLLLAAVAVPCSAKDEPVYSGPQKGEAIQSFKVTGVYDDQAGKRLDFVKQADGGPTVLVFVHKLTRPGAALMRTLTSYAASQKKLNGYIVWLDDDQAKAAAYLKRARKSLQLKVPVGVSTDGAEGPGAYGLNRNVELTIVVAQSNKVTANFALVQPSVTDSPKIAGAMAKLIDVKPPNQEQLTRLAYPKGNMRRPGPANDKRQHVDPKLGELLRAMIQKDASADDVAKSAAAVESHVGNDRTKRANVLRIAGVIIERKYGTDAAQAQARKWLEKYKPAD